MGKKNKIAKKGLPLLFVIIAITAGALFYYFWMNREPTINVYFLKGEKLVASPKVLHKEDEPLSKVAFGLLAGPTDAEKADGCFSEIPKGTQINSLRKDGEVLTVNFNEKLQSYGGGSAKVRGLVAQIVYTFTEVPGITKVRITIEGEKDAALGGEGYVIDRPLSREDVNY